MTWSCGYVALHEELVRVCEWAVNLAQNCFSKAKPICSLASNMVWVLVKARIVMLTSNVFPWLADSILTSVSKGYFWCAELWFESVERGRADLSNSKPRMLLVKLNVLDRPWSRFPNYLCSSEIVCFPLGCQGWRKESLPCSPTLNQSIR